MSIKNADRALAQTILRDPVRRLNAGFRISELSRKSGVSYHRIWKSSIGQMQLSDEELLAVGRAARQMCEERTAVVHTSRKGSNAAAAAV